MGEKKKEPIFLRPGERLSGHINRLVAEFDLEHRQELVIAVLKDFLGPWERIERQKRLLIAQHEQSVIEGLKELDLTVEGDSNENGNDNGGSDEVGAGEGGNPNQSLLKSPLIADNKELGGEKPGKKRKIS